MDVSARTNCFVRMYERSDNRKMENGECVPSEDRCVKKLEIGNCRKLILVRLRTIQMRVILAYTRCVHHSFQFGFYAKWFLSEIWISGWMRFPESEQSHSDFCILGVKCEVMVYFFRTPLISAENENGKKFFIPDWKIGKLSVVDL